MTTRLTSLVALALAGAFLVGCGDDDAGTTPPVDMGGGGTDLGPVTPVCPDDAPAPDNQMGACCSRASNASRLDAPELRLAALRLTAPMGTLTSPALRGILNDSFDGERFNWLIQAMGAPTTGNGPVTIRTGYGERAADGTFAFTMGAAPAPGDADRWDPITVTGMMTGETVATPAHMGPGPLTIPVFDETDPTLLVVELPVFGLELVNAPLTEDRSCIGLRTTTSYNTGEGGDLRAFIRVEDARSRMVVVPPSLSATLCAVIAGSLTESTYCDDNPQSMWTAKPNSLCGATGCEANTAGMTNICDPAISGAGGCNAWELLGEFAAQGVEITN
jgi:hypothetical protein